MQTFACVSVLWLQAMPCSCDMSVDLCGFPLAIHVLLDGSMYISQLVMVYIVIVVTLKIVLNLIKI